MNKSIAIYSSHDSLICINPNEGEYRIMRLKDYYKKDIINLIIKLISKTI